MDLGAKCCDEHVGLRMEPIKDFSCSQQVYYSAPSSVVIPTRFVTLVR